MAQKIKRKRPLKDKIVIGISFTLMVISVLAVLGVVLWNAKLFKGSNGEIKNNSDVLNSAKDNNNEKTSQDFNGENQVNFLVCGLDESGQMTDIIMVASIDLKKNTVNVLQIPRDTYVESGVGSTNKINSAYGSGEKSVTPINRLIKVINEQYQLKIDHYATVTIKSFRNIVDAIGGVPIDMPYQIGNAELGIIPAGKQTLDGKHAEWLVRHRHTYADQDIGRMKILRLFLASALQQVKKIGTKEVTKIIPAVYGNVTTDLSMSDMKKYASLALNINMDSIKMFIVPGEGITYKGQSVWSMHYYETADMLNEYFRPYGDDVPASSLKIKELAHTGEYYENTQDNLGDIINGADPGKKKSDDGSTPAYTHVVTQPKPVTKATTPSVTTSAPVTTSVTTYPTTTGEDIFYTVIPEGTDATVTIGTDEDN